MRENIGRATRAMNAARTTEVAERCLTRGRSLRCVDLADGEGMSCGMVARLGPEWEMVMSGEDVQYTLVTMRLIGSRMPCGVMLASTPGASSSVVSVSTATVRHRHCSDCGNAGSRGYSPLTTDHQHCVLSVSSCEAARTLPPTVFHVTWTASEMRTALRHRFSDRASRFSLVKLEPRTFRIRSTSPFGYMHQHSSKPTHISSSFIRSMPGSLRR